MRAPYTREVILYEGKPWEEAFDDLEKALSGDRSPAPRIRSLLDECRHQLGR